MAEPEHSIRAGESTPGTAGAPKRGLRRWLLCLIGLLYLLSVPWYRDGDAELRLIFGLPDWVAVALGCYVAIAILNCIVWLRTDIDDDAGEQSR